MRGKDDWTENSAARVLPKGSITETGGSAPLSGESIPLSCMVTQW